MHRDGCCQVSRPRVHDARRQPNGDELHRVADAVLVNQRENQRRHPDGWGGVHKFRERRQHVPAKHGLLKNRRQNHRRDDEIRDSVRARRERLFDDVYARRPIPIASA